MPAFQRAKKKVRVILSSPAKDIVQGTRMLSEAYRRMAGRIEGCLRNMPLLQTNQFSFQHAGQINYGFVILI